MLTPSLLLSSGPEIEIGAGTHCISAVMGPRIGKSRRSKEGALGGSLGGHVLSVEGVIVKPKWVCWGGVGDSRFPTQSQAHGQT